MSPQSATTVEGRARTLPVRVLEAIRKHGMWQQGDRVVVAVSGGMDSTVLMHLLHQLQDGHKGTIEVASIDHGLRAASAAEVATVGSVAETLGLPFHPMSLGLSPGPNLSARARDARRAALLKIGADHIATGHHQDDQAETVLHHLLRGSGTTGLRGMLPVQDAWCRPLLAEPRTVLRAWADSQELNWMEDPSNATSQRGRIRELMPALDALHGGAGGAMARAARLLAREDALLTELAGAAWLEVARDGGLDRARLAQLHPALQLRLLRRLADAVPVRADPLEAVVDGALRTPGRLDLGGGWTLVCQAGLLTVVPPA